MRIHARMRGLNSQSSTTEGLNFAFHRLQSAYILVTFTPSAVCFAVFQFDDELSVSMVFQLGFESIEDGRACLVNSDDGGSDIVSGLDAYTIWLNSIAEKLRSTSTLSDMVWRRNRVGHVFSPARAVPGRFFFAQEARRVSPAWLQEAPGLDFGHPRTVFF